MDDDDTKYALAFVIVVGGFLSVMFLIDRLTKLYAAAHGLNICD